MPPKKTRPTKKSLVIKTARKSKKQGKAVSEKPLSRRDITLKALRAYEVSRSNKILKLVPSFIKFYKKLSPTQITALKYYKGPGSMFQTQLLASYNADSGKPRELQVPFAKHFDAEFYKDILGTEKQGAIYSMYLPNTANLETYINDSYGKRIKILNDLDTVYDHPECPKLTGDEILFRGMELIPEVKKLKVGDTFLFKNFISTSIDRTVAETYSLGQCVFVLSGLKDIPCIYTPHPKTEDDIIAFINNLKIYRDISELTLPRNLEFEITNIEQRNINSSRASRNPNYKKNKIGELLKALKTSGITPKDEIIENAMFPKGTFIFARFKSWLPRKPIDFGEIKKNAKFILDTEALKTWNTENKFVN